TGAVGVQTQPSPGDHAHPVDTALAVDIAALDAGAASAGTSQKLPRGDHKHTISTGMPVGTGTANSQGTAPELARRDHVHKTQVVVGHNTTVIGIRPKINFQGATVSDDAMGDKVDVKVNPAHLALAVATSTDLGTWTALGQFTIDPAEWAPGATFNLLGQGSVTSAGLSGDIQLYNVTDGAQAALVNYTGMGDTSPSRKTSAFVPPSGAKVYELRIRVQGGGGAGSGDQIMVGWGGIRISY
ncbi:MAG TPA: hypothetical protein PKW90_28065, partial [Myxococcota bacterium]|nr:hypothetical protein [Myxococcota bacterium]